MRNFWRRFNIFFDNLIQNNKGMLPLSDREGYYYDQKCKLGSGNKHWERRPNIKNPVIAFVGASVPKQIADKVIELNDTTVTIVNLCIPAKDINEWNDPYNSVWKQASKTLGELGISPEEITVVWTMQDDLRDRGDQRFPEAPESLKKKLFRFFEVIEAKFPNVKQIDLASRTYSYDTDPKHGEPSSYHTGWANKWAVEASRKNSIFITDRCYMWTKGETPRKDGAITPISQYKVDSGDLVHFSPEGENYWGSFVLNYYKQFNWFV